MKIKLFVMDVDGTLTDGKIYISDQGELFKAFDIHDGYGIAHILSENEVVPVIITGRESEIVNKRVQELGIKELYQGVSDKLSQLKFVMEKYGVLAEEIAYIGDDINDMECIQFCGITGCPANAVREVKKAVNFISTKPGGSGAVREFIEWIVIK